MKGFILKKLIKTIFKTGKTATKSTGKSMDFLDDMLEKEYLSTAVDNLKTTSGKIVEKAGMVYQQTKDAVEDKVDMDKIKEMGDKIVEKGKAATEDLSETMQETSSTLKNVMKEGEDMVKGFMDKADGEEEE